MKRKAQKLLILIAVAAVAASALYFTPKTFLRGVDPDEVSRIDVFDGNTGVAFSVRQPEEVRSIVENIQSIPMRRDGISLGYMGYSFRLRFLDEDGRKLVRGFILNGEGVIRQDPFFYRSDGGLCWESLRTIEENGEAAVLQSP